VHAISLTLIVAYVAYNVLETLNNVFFAEIPYKAVYSTRYRKEMG